MELYFHFLAITSSNWGVAQRLRENGNISLIVSPPLLSLSCKQAIVNRRRPTDSVQVSGNWGMTNGTNERTAETSELQRKEGREEHYGHLSLRLREIHVRNNCADSLSFGRSRTHLNWNLWKLQKQRAQLPAGCAKTYAGRQWSVLQTEACTCTWFFWSRYNWKEMRRVTFEWFADWFKIRG